MLPDRIRSRADLDALLAASTNYEEKMPRDLSRRAFDLSRIGALLEALGRPQEGPRTVHVAGSKGKGSTCRMIAGVLRHAGHGPVGLYTSPHLQDLAERVEVDGQVAGEAELAAAADALLPHLRTVHGRPEAPTFFEILTAIAWRVFDHRGCTDVVLETGLGGRLDATNLCLPSVTVITTIELEHTRLLGETLEAIAEEKAGILKAGVPAVTTASEPALGIIRARARAVGAALHTTEDRRLAGVTLAPPAPGQGQEDNARAAYLALRLLGIDDATIRAGLETVKLPGILEPLDDAPLVLIDGAHTPASARMTRDAIRVGWPDKPVVVLLAMLQEKDVGAVAHALAQDVGAVVCTQVDSPRTVTAAELAAAVPHDRVVAEPDLPRALAHARGLATRDGLVLATGSIYLAGAVRSLVS